MLNSALVSANYAVEAGTGAKDIAETPRNSWGRLLAATLACVGSVALACYRV